MVWIEFLARTGCPLSGHTPGRDHYLPGVSTPGTSDNFLLRTRKSLHPSGRFNEKWSIHAGGALPLTTVHRRLGVLLLGNDKAEGYSPEDICFLSLAADLRASAIDYAANSRASQVAEDRLKPLWDSSNSVVSKLERRDRLWLVIDTISALVRALLPDSSSDFIDRALENEDSP